MAAPGHRLIDATGRCTGAGALRSRGLRRPLWSAAAASALGLALAPTHGSAQELATDTSLARSITLGYEVLRLPGSERMGLTSASLLFEVAQQWWFGPVVFGAATGERGGLFVGGVALQRRWQLADRLELQAGLALGGGGGGAAPVGSGLLVRSELGLMRDFGPLKAGLTLSDARFPSSPIQSRQLGAVLVWDGTYRHFGAADEGRRVDAEQASGLGFDRWQGGLQRYRIGPDGRHIGLVAARAERHIGDGRWSWGFDAAAAAHGGAAGYMELLAGAGWSLPLSQDLSAGVRASLGLGGGGGVPNGGGVLAKASAHLAWQLVPGWHLGIEQGWGTGIAGRPALRTSQLWVAHDLVPFRGSQLDLSDARVVRYEWVGGVQHVQRARRNNGQTAAFDQVSGKVNRALGDNLYLSMQAHSAFAGGVGAYSVGLLGAGLRTQPGALAGWRLGVEALVGAAGGGGVSTGGGAIGQALAWAAMPMGRDSRLQLGLGQVRSLRGTGLNSPVLELSWAHDFGLAGR